MKPKRMSWETLRDVNHTQMSIHICAARVHKWRDGRVWPLNALVTYERLLNDKQDVGCDAMTKARKIEGAISDRCSDGKALSLCLAAILARLPIAAVRPPETLVYAGKWTAMSTTKCTATLLKTLPSALSTTIATESRTSLGLSLRPRMMHLYSD